MTAPILDLKQQPVSDIQLSQLKVEWIPRENVKPNNYNPNKMTWHDRMLLRQSLLEDGWTQPIVVLADHTIVDGEQRWATAGVEIKPSDIQEIIAKMEERKASGHPESDSILSRLRESQIRLEAAIQQGLPATIASITGGLVPITVLDLGDEAHKILSTIRHNRARGTHQIDAMAGLTQDLVQLGLDLDDLESRLGMDDEEITRFLNMANEAETLLLHPITADFSNAVVPTYIATAIENDPLLAADLGASAEANKKMAEYNLALAERNQQIQQAAQAEIEKQQQDQKRPLMQDEKATIVRAMEATLPLPTKPAPPVLVKVQFFVTREESEIINQVLGVETQAVNLVKLCRQTLEQRVAVSVTA